MERLRRAGVIAPYDDCELRAEEATPASHTDVKIKNEFLDSYSFSSKRRKLGEPGRLSPVNIALDAESPQISRLQVDLNSLIDDAVSDDEDCEQSSNSMPFDFSELFSDRLSVLQRLIPHGSELDIEEILKVAIDYVKALEKEIQMFNKSKQEVPTIASSSSLTGVHVPIDISETSIPSEGSALQKRGLCIMPLTALAKAF
eukprot:c17103_g1_i1 orf=853-1455(+)